MNLTLKKKNGGFSLVEVMMTVTIIAILSTTVTMSISRYVLERKGEAPVMAFYSQLQQMKAFSQRDNDRYLVVLKTDGSKPAFEIHRDVEYDGTPTTTNNVQLFVEQTSIANSITELSFSHPNENNLPKKPETNDWESSKMITFDKDEISTINEGYVFMRNKSAEKIYYAIVRPEKENTLKFYKLNGSSWKEL
ncbi:MAG: prepilin-type N-terminal cleavage/methylation domain-containing protein [Chitinivibrionia bacterium]|nr:prepilin-type N-terminal cleavage/methylation domain-containing protein [Chitinivibrionia bacterium]